MSKIGLFDYLGKPIKKYFTSPKEILEKYKPFSYQLLDFIIPTKLTAEANVFEVQKWLGNKKESFIYLARTKNHWYRLATKREADTFLVCEKTTEGEKKRQKKIIIGEAKKDDNTSSRKISKGTKSKN